MRYERVGDEDIKGEERKRECVCEGEGEGVGE
jgi:hypothetical protein